MSEWKETEIGKMPVNWEVKKIGEIGNVTKLAGFEYSKYFNYVEDGEIIALRALNVREGNLDLNDIKKIYKNVSDSLKRSKLYKGDILFTYVGANIGQFALVPENDKFHLAPNICRIRCSAACEPYYLFSYFRTNAFRDSLEGFSHGSSQPTLPMGSIRQIPIPIPSIIEQLTIASILSSIDDKINLLQLQNATLEKMAETLFRQWFVEEAKEEWEEGTLDDILSVKGGTTPSTSEADYWDGTIHWTSPRDITNLNGIYLFDTERKITDLGLSKISSGLLPKGTLLMSSRAPVGVLAFAEIPVAINQGYIAIIDNKGVSKEFIYLWLKTNIDVVHSFSNGSTFMEISKSSFKTLQLQIPPNPILEEFKFMTQPMFNKIKSNQTQIRTLTALRNTLLPKLMSGEVKVDMN